VHPNLLRTIARAVSSSGELETGGPLFGTLQRSWPDRPGPPNLIASLLATVPPGPALRADEGWVSLGRQADGERAASALRWWRAVTGIDLVHLGDWHKHHASMPEPSPGDRSTAARMAAATDSPLWLAAIAVGDHSQKEETEAKDNRAGIVRSTADCEQVRFYRAVTGLGLKPVTVLVAGDALPALPALPWHVAHPARFAAECRLLAAVGFGIAIEASDSLARPGLTLRLRSETRPGFTIVTGPGFPIEAPLARDAAGKRLKTSGTWSAARFLVDLLPEEG
jgi:hypothetical protein